MAFAFCSLRRKYGCNLPLAQIVMAPLGLAEVLGGCSPWDVDRLIFQLHEIELQPELVISRCLKHRYCAVLCSVLNIKKCMMVPINNINANLLVTSTTCSCNMFAVMYELVWLSFWCPHFLWYNAHVDKAGNFCEEMVFVKKGQGYY